MTTIIGEPADDSNTAKKWLSLNGQALANLFLKLKENYKKFGISSFQIPNDLSKIYNKRSLREEVKPSRCWSSLVSPPLYGTNLMCCVLWDRITDLSYHYGVMEGNIGELERMMSS